MEELYEDSSMAYSPCFPVRFAAAEHLNGLLQIANDREARTDSLIEFVDVEANGLIGVRNKFFEFFDIPEQLQSTFDEGFVLSYHLLQTEAINSRQKLPAISSKDMKGYMKQACLDPSPQNFVDRVEYCLAESDLVAWRFINGYVEGQKELTRLEARAIKLGFLAMYEAVFHQAGSDTLRTMWQRNN
jgi:hypothetical protein